jgi:hypothetical protein
VTQHTSSQNDIARREDMMRKTIVAIAAAATIGGAVTLSATEASARHVGWGGGYFAFHGGGFRHFGGFRGAFYGGGYYPYYAYGHSCWRWVPTSWGLRRVWVC